MVITSLDNDKIKGLIKLKQRKYREKTNTFLIEGMHLVLEAYKKGMIKELILEENEVLPINAPTTYVTKEILKKLSTLETPNKVMALCNKLTPQKEWGERLLLLDEIQDPGNLGTIIRSAVAFHIDTIILGKNTVDLYNPKVIRGTQGMMFHINITTEDLKDVIPSLKKQEIPIYGTRVQFGEDCRSLLKKDKTSFALIMGNEGNGVTDEIMDLCDKFLYIAMDDNVESLNVAIATSILLYELDKERETCN